MKEPIDLIQQWRCLPPGTPAILATVVATQGSTYRRPGARMLLTREGWAAGSISGGCLEGDLIRTAWDRTEDGPALITYDATADDDIVWGFGLGCNGVVQVLVERLPSDGGVLRYLADCVEGRRPLSIRTLIDEGPGLGEHRFAHPEAPSQASVVTVEVDGRRWLEESLLPPRPLLIFGAGHDAVPLVAAAKSLGWHVTVIDGRTSYARPERFPAADRVVALPPHRVGSEVPVDSSTAAVVMTHNFLHDLELVRSLLPSPLRYVGLLGPSRRADRLLKELEREGYRPSPEELAKLHAPIGLDLGAEGPDEIALAIVAEIQAFFGGRPAGHLRGSAEPLHPESHCSPGAPSSVTRPGLCR